MDPRNRIGGVIRTPKRVRDSHKSTIPGFAGALRRFFGLVLESETSCLKRRPSIPSFSEVNKLIRT